MTKGYRFIMQTHLVIWSLHLALGNLPQTPYLGKMTKFGNLVSKKAQYTKKRLELVMSFLTLLGVFTLMMAHHQVDADLRDQIERKLLHICDLHFTEDQVIHHKFKYNYFRIPCLFNYRLGEGIFI